MAKNKKQISDIEAIESYFTTDNEHHNEYTFKLYKAAKENELFNDLEIPLWLFDAATIEFYENRKKPLQTLTNFKTTFKEKKLSKEQQIFILEHLIGFFKNTVYYDESGNNEISLKQVAELLEREYKILNPKSKDEYIPTQSTYNFALTKKHLETLPDIKEKIKYLTEEKTLYLQNRTGWDVDLGTPYDKQCELEIKKLKAIAQLETIPAQTRVASKFTLSKALSKIDYIRIINALWELRCFQNKDETYPSKIDVMTAFGDLVNIDLSDYSNNMNKAFNSNVNIEQNIEIFDKLQKKTKDLYLNNQNKPKK